MKATELMKEHGWDLDEFTSLVLSEEIYAYCDDVIEFNMIDLF